MLCNCSLSSQLSTLGGQWVVVVTFKLGVGPLKGSKMNAQPTPSLNHSLTQLSTQ